MSKQFNFFSQKNLIVAYCSPMNRVHLSFIPLRVYSLGTAGATQHAFLISPVSPFLAVSNYIKHKYVQTLFLLLRNQFSRYMKKTSVTQVSCVVLYLWEGLLNPQLVVKSCLHKSEVVLFFFVFFVEQEPGQTYSIIETWRKQ